MLSEAHNENPRRIAIVGGGISGLAAAHRLRELDDSLEVHLLEAAPRLGGVLQTERRDGYLIERSADMFTTKQPWALDLCRRIGFDQQLIGASEEHRRAFIIRNGRLIPTPEGLTLMAPTRLWPMLTTPLLSGRGKLRVAWEYFVPAGGAEDESLASFATRRLGREAYERIVQPMIGGIYTADPQRLSMAATMPQFLEMERSAGGLLRAMRSRPGGKEDREASGARYSVFVTPREGMSSLIEAIADRLPADRLRCNTRVDALAPDADGGWRLEVNQVGRLTTESYDAVVLAAGAPAAGRLLRGVDELLAEELAAIPHAGAAVVAVGYRRDQIQHPLDGFGCVAPLVEGRRVLAISFSSVKFPHRAPEGAVLLRVFVGGACQPELAELGEPELLALVEQELAELLGVAGPPEVCEVIRWRGAMPQYHVGHLDRIARIGRRLDRLPTLKLAGNALRGVGIPFCVHSGEQAAEELVRDD